MSARKEIEMKRFNIRMPQEMYDRIEVAAHKRGVAVSAFINMKLDEILKQDETAQAMNVITDPAVLNALMLQNKMMNNEE